MKVVVAIDSLKGSLTSLEAGEAIQEGILRAISDAEVIVRPLADGGEGTVEALTRGMNGRYEKITVTDPLGRPTDAVYGILEDLHTAIIEMSAAAGITLIDVKDRNPMNTTTYGVGEMIKDAIGKGCRHFFIGIGGSATNDGGIGMLQALGYGMLDTEGKQVSLGAKGLAELVSITDEDVLPELKKCTFQIACDVKNPLCGEKGCSAVFGPQKGATPDMITQMDRWLGKYALLTANRYKKADSQYPGTGAAGGMGFAFLSYMNAELRSGVQIVLEETKLEEYVKDADIVVTGEGCLDGQSVMGKAPIGVAALAKKHHKKVIAFAGCVTEDAKVCNQNGIDAFFPILRNVVTREEAMQAENARRNMMDTAEQVFRLIKVIINEA
ncbi:MAG: glycerate kinase [Lachnospiraceae bacterium]|nr:MAG: glycerate kinase [Lachnospiraceae bacterium]